MSDAIVGGSTASFPKLLERRIDFWGTLGALLRELSGFRTFAFELLQNADDAGAVEISFSTSIAGIVVDNSGTFTDCGAPDAATCSRAQEGPPCDFHRFLNISARGKRDEEGTTGAFGIGFTAVYQVTDRPELISNGRHWILSDGGDGGAVLVCPGCHECLKGDLPGTRFILPWARDPKSPGRKNLEAPVVEDKGIAELEEILNVEMPSALLFLRHLRQVTITTQHGSPRLIKREDGGTGRLDIVHDGVREQWLTKTKSFDAEAGSLMKKATTVIPRKRQATVTIAARLGPGDSSAKGRLCAFLPTEQASRLPIHINADFAITSDRKRLASEGPSAEWNSAALRAAAGALAEAMPEWVESLGSRAVLEIVRRVYDCRPDDLFGVFWKTLHEAATALPIVETTAGNAVLPKEVLLGVPDEASARSALELLGLKLLHPELKAYHNLLVVLGARELILDDAVRALRVAGAETSSLDLENAPAVLKDGQRRKALLQWADEKTGRATSCLGLENCAVLRGLDGRLWAPSAVFVSDDETTALFAAAPFRVSFLDPKEIPFAGGLVTAACRRFDPAEALRRLREAEAGEGLPSELAEKVLRWFAMQPGVDSWRRELAGRRLFPTASGLAPLVALSLPSDFSDPLGIATLLETEGRDWLTRFATILGAQALRFDNYLRSHLLPTVKAEGLGADKRLVAVRWLASHHGRIAEQDKSHVIDELSESPVVLCQDGIWRNPGDVHFRNAETLDVLGEAGPFAAEDDDGSDSLARFFVWLGVRTRPRLEAVVSRVLQTVSRDTPEQAARFVQRMWDVLSQRTRKSETLPPALRPLTDSKWLPVVGDRRRWYQPQEVVASFQAHICDRGARILDLPAECQQESVGLMKLVGVPRVPTSQQVIGHLLSCRADGAAVNPEVYRHLGEKGDWTERDLPDLRVLQVKDRGGAVVFVRVADTFRAHPFGRMRWTLSPDVIERYRPFLRRLNFRDDPNYADAIAVLKDCARDYQARGMREDAEDGAILQACWCLLSDACKVAPELAETLATELGGVRCIANRRGLLICPRDAFFNDRLDLTEPFGPFLSPALVERVASTMLAQECAGVEYASDVIKTSAKAEGVMDDPETTGRLKERGSLILQACEAVSPGGDFDADLVQRTLASVRVKRAATLKRLLSAWIDGSLQQGAPVPTAACWDSEARSLFVALSDGSVRWEAVSRELAGALQPRKAPGALASALATVLVPGSAEEAERAASDLGWRRLSADSIVTATASAPVGLGDAASAGAASTELTPDEMAVDATGQMPEVGQAEMPGASPNRRRVFSGSDVDSTEKSDGRVGRAGGSYAGGAEPHWTDDPDDEKSDSENETEGVDESAGDGGPRRRREEGGGRVAGAGAGRRGGTSHRTRTTGPHRTPGARAGRFRTYVEQEAGSDQRPEQTDRNREVAEAAVQAAVNLERSRGREPHVMDDQHPGFDIRSGDRLIEVKGLRGSWGERGIALTRREFETGLEEGFVYWLYVVEHALSRPRVYCIQDPARKVDQFFYDDGWKGASDDACGPVDASGG